MSFKKVLGKVIPVAASVASSGLLGGGVAKQVTDILGLGSKPTEKDVEAALAKASPDQYVALHKLEADTKKHAQDAGLKLAELDVERERIHSQDRDSARKRQMAVRDRTPDFLAFGIIGCLITVIMALIFRSAHIIGRRAGRAPNPRWHPRRGSDDDPRLLLRIEQGLASEGRRDPRCHQIRAAGSMSGDRS